MENLSSIFKKAYLVMKAGAKTIKVQKKAITLQQLDAKIRIWQPIVQISNIEKSQNFKYPLSFMRKNIESEFYIDSIKYMLIRQLWWIFDFTQSTKKEEQSIQACIQSLTYNLKQKYYRISNIDLQNKIYLSELVILVMCKLVSRFFANSFTQIKVGGLLQSQVYIILNKLFIGIQVGPKAYHLHLQHLSKQTKNDKISEHKIKIQDKAQNKQNQKPIQVVKQEIKSEKLGTLILARQGLADKISAVSNKKQSNQSKHSKIMPPSQIRFAKRKNSRIFKASRGFLYQRSKKRNLGPIFQKVQDEQELRFKQQLKKTLQVSPLPQTIQRKYSLGEISEKYLREQKKHVFQGKSPLIYQKENKKKSLSLQRISQTMSHELVKSNFQVSSTKERKISFKPQSYSNHYQIINDITKAQPQNGKAKQSKLYKSSLSKKNIGLKFNQPINFSKSGVNTPVNGQERKQLLSGFQNREGISRSRTYNKVDHWNEIIKNLSKQSLKDKIDTKELVSVYQKKLIEKATLGHQILKMIDKMKQNENRIQLEKLWLSQKNKIAVFCGNSKQEESRQLLVNLIRIAPQKVVQLEEESDYILKNKSLKDLNSRQLRIQKLQFQKLCQRQDQMHKDYNLLIQRAKGERPKTLYTNS